MQTLPTKNACLLFAFSREDPRDVKTLAQLIKAYSRLNLKKAEQYPYLYYYVETTAT